MLKIMVILAIIPLLLLGGFAQAAPVRAQSAGPLPGQFVYVDDTNNLNMVRGDLSRPIKISQMPYGYSASSPHFSRDGRYLAYCTRKDQSDERPQIYVMNTVTFEKTLVTNEGACNYDWSPDGNTLIYTEDLWARYSFQERVTSWDVFAYSVPENATRILFTSDKPLTEIGRSHV